MDRNEQINWIRAQAAIAQDADYSGEASAEEIAEFYLSQAELPEWFDDHDRGLLVRFIIEEVGCVR